MIKGTIYRLSHAVTAAAFVCFAILFFGSCQDHNKKNTESNRPGDSATASKPPAGISFSETTTHVHQELQINKLQRDSLIEVTVKQGSIPDSIALTLDHNYQRLHVRILQVKGKDSLIATLRAPGTGRNLRFNQIQLPDGTLDGPFGRELHYSASSDGDYTLMLGKDNMADGSVRGPLVIYIKLK
jgi:hypothetical protein